MNVKKLMLFILAIGMVQASGQNLAQIGKASDDLLFSTIKNYSKASARLSDFKDKVVILNFWATWCSPCVQALPHLENLQEEFKQDLQIITITNESVDRIQRYLAKGDLALPVVFDHNRKLSDYFPHRSIPHTIVIDKNGMIRAITTTSEINREVIIKAISDEPLELSEKKDNMSFDPSIALSGNSNSTYQITVTPYQHGLPSMASPSGGKGYLNRRILAVNLTPRTLYEIAYQFPAYIRTVIESSDKSLLEWKKENAICMDIIVPEEKGAGRFEIMKQQLENLYHYKVSVKKRLTRVKALKTIKGGKANLSETTGGERFVASGGAGLSMKNAGIDAIAEFLQGQLKMPVIDDTKLKGYYDVSIDWYSEDPDAIHEALKKLGLKLVDDRRKIDMLVIGD